MVAALAAAGIYGVKRLRTTDVARPGVFVPAAMASALAALPDGGLLYGEQRTGRVFEVSADGTSRKLVAELDVATNGDRGLMGLTVDPSGAHRYASWVAPDGRFAVGELTPGGAVVTWIGPLTGERENGGRIAWSPRGLVFAAGAQGAVASREDQASPLGKLLYVPAVPVAAAAGGPAVVAAAAPAAPAVLSSGWSDPAGLSFDAAGDLWVVDAGARERLARGDVGGHPTEVTTWETPVAPTGLAVSGPAELVVCTSAAGTLQRFSTEGERPEMVQDAVAPCRHAVAVLADGRWATALDDGIRIEDPPPAGTGAS